MPSSNVLPLWQPQSNFLKTTRCRSGWWRPKVTKVVLFTFLAAPLTTPAVLAQTATPPRTSKSFPHGVEFFAALDNFINNRDQNTGLFAANGTSLPIYRAEVGRTLRLGFLYAFQKENR